MSRLILCLLLLVLSARSAAAQCSFAQEDRRRPVASAVLFTEPPTSLDPVRVLIGDPERSTLLILSTAHPRRFIVSRTPETQLLGVFLNGPEGTSISGDLGGARLVQHLAGSPDPDCEQLGLAKVPPETLDEARISVQSVALALIGRAPDQTVGNPAGDVAIGGDAQSAAGGTVVGTTITGRLEDPAVQEGLKRHRDLVTGVAATPAPPPAGCALPPALTEGAALEVFSIGQASAEPIPPKPSAPGLALQAPERRFDLVVTRRDAPVVLVLSAYHPTQWRIGLGEGADLRAVVLTGFGAQRIIGLPAALPILTHTGAQPDPVCLEQGWIPVPILDQPVAAGLGGGPPLPGPADPVERLTGRKADQRQILLQAEMEGTTIGPGPMPDLLSARFSPERGPVFTRDLVPPGLVGLAWLFETRRVRLATGREIDQWYGITYPQFVGNRAKVPRHRLSFGSAVALDRATALPEGLKVDEITWLVPAGIALPTQGIGETEVYSMAEKVCRRGSAGAPCDTQ